MINILLATQNAKKIAELTAMLAAAGLTNFSVLPPEHYGPLPPVEETEETFEGNARLKAHAVLNGTEHDGWVLADDSGMCVDALDGEPGVYSARYAGPTATDADRSKKILNELAKQDDPERTARFVCSLVFLHPQYGEHIFTGIVRGEIADRPRGENGFGYDPIFVPSGSTKTFAELSSEEKNAMSHRGAALEKLIDFLSQYPYAY